MVQSYNRATSLWVHDRRYLCIEYKVQRIDTVGATRRIYHWRLQCDIVCESSFRVRLYAYVPHFQGLDLDIRKDGINTACYFFEACGCDTLRRELCFITSTCLCSVSTAEVQTDGNSIAPVDM